MVQIYPNAKDSESDFDVFISHASEDKYEIARLIRENLVSHGFKVWMDEDNISLGDSLRSSIDIGLSKSRFGIVILSPDYIKKQWTNRELSGLLARENNGSKIILPVWHRVKPEDILDYSPILADRLAISTEMGIEKVCSEIIRAINPQFSKTKMRISNNLWRNIFSFNQLLDRKKYLKYLTIFYIVMFLANLLYRSIYESIKTSEFIDSIELNRPLYLIYLTFALFVLYIIICVVANRLRDMGIRGRFVFLYIGIWYILSEALRSTMGLSDTDNAFDDTAAMIISYILFLPLAAPKRYDSR